MTTYLEFQTRYPELFTVPITAPISQTDWENQRLLVELETMAFSGLICIPYALRNSTVITLSTVSNTAMDLYQAHIIVSQNSNYESLAPDITKKVESLDNKIEFAFKGFDSRYSLDTTAYGKRLLMLLDKYSCSRQAEESRNSLHEFSGISAEIPDFCNDCTSEEDYFLPW